MTEKRFRDDLHDALYADNPAAMGLCVVCIVIFVGCWLAGVLGWL